MADQLRESVIKMSHVSKRFIGVHAVEDVSFEVAEGEFVAILGPSGCGKSTLLKLIAGLIPLTGGEILLNGEPVRGTVKGVGMVFQTPNLLPWRNVLQNTLLPAEVLHLDHAKSVKQANDLINLAGLNGFEEKLPFELSGGMQQRVSLCRALLTDPRVLLMDEPFGALDAITREKMNLELLKVWEKTRKTVVFVTHSIQEALFLADRVIVMTARPGKIRSILEDDLPRPRTQSVFTMEQFAKYAAKLRSQIITNGESGEPERAVSIE